VTCRHEVLPNNHIPIKAKNGAMPEMANEPFQSAAPLKVFELIPDGVGLGLELELDLELELVGLRPFKTLESEPESGRPLPLPGVLVGRGLVELKVGMGYVEVSVMV